MSVANKVVLITGAARGLGFEYARSLGQAGARVVAGDIADCANASQAAGNGAIGVTLDVTDVASAVSMVELAMERFGRVDALINNAALYGALRGGRFNEIEEANWDAAMAVNVKGIWNCCKAAVPAMKQAGGGSIVNIASIAAHRGVPRTAIYTMSKHGVLALTRTLAAEWATRGVRVNAVSPGFFMTPLNRDKMAPERKEAALRRTPMHRFGELDELVGAAIYLASPAASYVTGETIAVDGGFLATGLD
jgi:NAD(P)-dependent dehydrogenase (short-subunit alcohol dehydrogenase family)